MKPAFRTWGGARKLNTAYGKPQVRNLYRNLLEEFSINNHLEGML